MAHLVHASEVLGEEIRAVLPVELQPDAVKGQVGGVDPSQVLDQRGPSLGGLRRVERSDELEDLGPGDVFRFHPQPLHQGRELVRIGSA